MISVRIAVTGVLAAGVIAAGAVIQSAGIVPYWVPFVGEDSGVAACRAMAEATAQDGASPIQIAGLPEGATSAEKIRAARGLFADSSDEAIREYGVQLMDITSQAASFKDGDGSELGAALALMGPLTTSYAGLAGACGEYGHVLPPMVR